MKFDYSILYGDALVFDAAVDASAVMIDRDKMFFSGEGITDSIGILRLNAVAKALEDAPFHKTEHKAAVVRTFREAEDIFFALALMECDSERLYTLGADLARVAQIAFRECVKEGSNLTLKVKIEDYDPLFWEEDRKAILDGLMIMSYVTEQYILPDKWDTMKWGFEDMVYGRYGTPFSRWKR